MPTKNYQEIYDVAQKENLDPRVDEKVITIFEALNSQYSYFSPDDLQSRLEFVRYFNFFNSVKNDEDHAASFDELCSRAYKATVLFGGVESRNACKTLQKIIYEGFADSETPLKDFFDTVEIPKKVEHLNLEMWRSHINGPYTKKALGLFESAADLANKFGAMDGYLLRSTGIFPNLRNTELGVLSLYQQKSRSELERPDSIGFAFKINEQELKRAKINPALLPAGYFDNILKKIVATPMQTLTLAEEQAIFSAINENSPELALSRQKSFYELEMLTAKLFYKRFDEAPEFATLSHQYKLSEDDFNKCVDLLPHHKKTQDNLPDITIDGSAIGHPGYFFVKLPIDDPHALILGKITNCCQSIGGDSELSVREGWKDDDKCFYVLLKGDSSKSPMISGAIDYENFKIVGQAYAWRSTHGNLTLDSWENARPLAHDKIAVPFLTAFSKAAVEDPNAHVFRVTIGVAGDGRTPEEFKQKKHEAPIENIARGFQYPDSHEQTEIASRLDNPKLKEEWEKTISDKVEALAKFSDAEKATLKKYAPKSEQYPEMLQAAATDPILSQGLKIVSTCPDNKQKENLYLALTFYSTTPVDSIHPNVRKFFAENPTIAVGKITDFEHFSETVKRFSTFSANNKVSMGLYEYAKLKVFSQQQNVAHYLMREQNLTPDNAMKEIAQLNDAQLYVLKNFYNDGLRGDHLRNYVPPPDLDRDFFDRIYPQAIKTLITDNHVTPEKAILETNRLGIYELACLRDCYQYGLRGEHLRAAQENKSPEPVTSQQLRDYFDPPGRRHEKTPVIPPANSDARDLIILVKLKTALDAFDKAYPTKSATGFSLSGLLGAWEKTTKFVSELKGVMNSSSSAREKNHAIQICLQKADSAGGSIIDLLKSNGLIDANKKPSAALFPPFVTAAATLRH